MRKFLLTLILLSITQTAFAGYTKPYFRKDGTLVHGHYRSKSNQTKFDNYSTKGNINPYTRKKGSNNPYNYKRKSNKNYPMNY